MTESSMPLQKIPLFIVTGASGVGKTTVVPSLKRLLPDCDVFDTDLIFDGSDWKTCQRNWMRIVKSLAEQGRHAVLCGTLIPERLAEYDEIMTFSTIYYLDLHCSDALRNARLAARGYSAEVQEDYCSFARWLLANAGTAFDPPMEILDATDLTPDEAAILIQQWVLACMEYPGDAEARLKDVQSSAR